jgi:dihydroorotate dehydrogenase
MYFLIKQVLFQFEPENVHHFVTRALKFFNRFAAGGALTRLVWDTEQPELERTVFGLKFRNPVGLAAGFDKNAEFISEMANLGFGFIEVGTVTPLPQEGNPKPRMFRLRSDEALINRMGFNNHGVDVVAARIARYRKNAPEIQQGLIIGGNIGKNKNTPNDEAVDDYVVCFDRLFDVVDYFVVNVSSPNTPGLRELQEKAPLMHILNTLQARNAKLGARRPILLKIAPDLNNEQLDDIIEIVKLTGIAGIIATNTTLDRSNLKANRLKHETGGLSGKPLSKRSTEIVQYLSDRSKGLFSIIGVGGIHDTQDAADKLKAGAALIQLYTGFIYEGPGLIKKINKKILSENI